MSPNNLLLDYSVVPHLANANHNSLELSLKVKHSEKQVCTSPTTIKRYEGADYIKPNQMIKEIDWDFLLNENNIDFSATNWHNKFMER